MSSTVDHTNVVGAKHDGGKRQWGLLMVGLSLALGGVVDVLMFGARKYAANSWQSVPNGVERYTNALYRHLNEIAAEGILSRDEETGLLHWQHVACNALFLCWFAMMEAKRESNG